MKNKKPTLAQKMYQSIICICSYVIRPRYQFLVSVIFTLFLFGVFHAAYKNKVIFEKHPVIYPITDKDTHYAHAAKVEMGFHINDFSVFNMQENEFIFDAKVWFLFDKDQISLDVVEKFDFTRGTISQQRLEETKMIEGKFFAQYDIQVEFKADLNQKYFPFDDHRIYIELINTVATPEEVLFYTDLSSFVISRNLLIIGWHPTDHALEVGINKSVLDRFDAEKSSTHPSVLFSVDFTRDGIQNILLVFLPLFLMVFIGLFSLGLDPKISYSSMFNLALTAVTGLMGYRFVLQSLMPRVSYFLLSDCFFLLLLGVSFFVFCASLMIAKVGKVTDTVIIYRGVVFIASYIVLIALSCYFLFYWA